MICYRDRTYCDGGVMCRDSYTCDRVITPDIMQKARDANLPISIMNFANQKCFVPFFATDKKPKRRKRK